MHGEAGSSKSKDAKIADNKHTEKSTPVDGELVHGIAIDGHNNVKNMHIRAELSTGDGQTDIAERKSSFDELTVAGSGISAIAPSNHLGSSVARNPIQLQGGSMGSIVFESNSSAVRSTGFSAAPSRAAARNGRPPGSRGTGGASGIQPQPGLAVFGDGAGNISSGAALVGPGNRSRIGAVRGDRVRGGPANQRREVSQKVRLRHQVKSVPNQIDNSQMGERTAVTSDDYYDNDYLGDNASDGEALSCYDEEVDVIRSESKCVVPFSERFNSRSGSLSHIKEDSGEEVVPDKSYALRDTQESINDQASGKHKYATGNGLSNHESCDVKGERSRIHNYREDSNYEEDFEAYESDEHDESQSISDSKMYARNHLRETEEAYKFRNVIASNSTSHSSGWANSKHEMFSPDQANLSFEIGTIAAYPSTPYNTLNGRIASRLHGDISEAGSEASRAGTALFQTMAINVQESDIGSDNEIDHWKPVWTETSGLLKCVAQNEVGLVDRTSFTSANAESGDFFFADHKSKSELNASSDVSDDEEDVDIENLIELIDEAKARSVSLLGQTLYEYVSISFIVRIIFVLSLRLFVTQQKSVRIMFEVHAGAFGVQLVAECGSAQ